MEVKGILKDESPPGKDLYFIKYSNDDVCVTGRVLSNRYAENDGKLFAMWDGGDISTYEDKVEYKQSVRRLPDKFERSEVHLKQGATKEHLDALLNYIRN